ncbi:MAG: cation transporter [Clostridia bacterium]|nr:cation transporter [Clostridia bacterium]MBO5914967.1 cation transporter [Clostridia bacterium]
MIKLLAKIFIKDRENTADTEVRRKYGVLCGGCGIALNLLLFALKLFVGTLTGSVAVTADAVNNISDAGSSAVTMVGFRLAGKKPDPEHPFGHGRIEYISGLIVAMLIFVMGFELITSSLNAIIDPKPTEINIISVVILVFSVLVKLYMFFYNRKIGKKIGSAAMTATASDSIGDACATLAVLVSLVVSRLSGLLIDGYMGLLVAAFILFAGYRAAKETIEPLLGMRPDKELVDELEEIVLSSAPICGVHDLILHDYGPGRRFLSLHAEVPMDEDILHVHDIIDNVEIEIYERFGIETVIHTDPIDTRDPRLNEIKETVRELLCGIDARMKAHDFRMVPGVTHTNIVFDIAIPADSKIDTDAFKLAVSAAVSAKNPEYRCVIRIDRDYA